MTYDEAVRYILDIPKYADKRDLEDTKADLHRLGDPDSRMKIIHVAGTNGKGSTCAFMNSVLRAAGYHVAMFTSPHLVDIRERFAVDDRMVSKDTFLQAFNRVREVVSGGSSHPSFFEYLFLMAMAIFDKAHCDFVILETGLGGRLDATNAVCQKIACVITRISLDHTDILGHSIEDIAAEKAGIIMRGVPVVCLSSSSMSDGRIWDRARELGCEITLVDDSRCEGLEISNYIHFTFHSLYHGDAEITVPGYAVYQAENAMLALAVLEVVLGESMSAESMQAGIYSMRWPGRMECLGDNIYADGAHNPDGVRAFVESVRLDGCSYRALIIGIARDKDVPRMVDEIASSHLFDRVVTVPFPSPRAMDPDALCRVFAGRGITAIARGSARQALDTMHASSYDRVYVAGSLYLVGHVMQIMREK